MSAICGILQIESSNASIILDALFTALADYGPDGGGQWVEGAIGLGQQQLRVTSENQEDALPYYDEKTRLVIAADTFLDNRSALYDQLSIPRTEGHKLSDSQLILRAYQRWGCDCPSRLFGDFSFAIWDPDRRVLFCARDHIGAKPFYYHVTAQRFAFASDINSLLAIPNICQQLNEPYIAATLLYVGFAHPEHTFYQAICKLPPGHSMTIGLDTVELERYWQPENSPTIRFNHDDDYVEAFLEIYAQVIRDCVRTTDPVGVHLSGGLDSSSIAVLAARELRKQERPLPAAICWQPSPQDGPPQSGSEHALIELVCQQEGLTPHYVSPTAADILAVLRKDITRQPTNLLLQEEVVQQRARDLGVRLLLSGWGGDEGISFDGRGYYPSLLRQGRWRELYQASLDRSTPFWKFILTHACLPLIHPNALNTINTIRRGQWPARYRSMIHPQFSRRVKPLRNVSYTEKSVRSTQLWLLQNGHLADRIESWAASGAQHQIVYRYPLLDRRLLEFALGLPPEQYRRGRWNRWFMRNALAQILPTEVCWHPSKADPIRVQTVLDAIPDALVQVANTLAARTAPPARAHYINMPRLIRHLDPDHFRTKPKLGKILPALLLLDWEP